MSDAAETLSWPSDARGKIGAVKLHLDYMSSQLIGLACEWHEGPAGRSEFLKNIYSVTCQMKEDIEALQRLAASTKS